MASPLALPPVPRDCITCDGGCGRSAPSKRCSNCQTVYYCSRDCQKAHYKEHKTYCYSIDFMKKQNMGLGEGAVLLSKDEVINSECAICLEDAMVNPIVLERCKHSFCSSCLFRWQEREARYPPSETSSAQVPSAHHSCPMCRAETTNVADSLLVSARLDAERANRPGCAPEEAARFRQQALTNVQQALDSELPDLNAYCIKVDVLIALGEGHAALDCMDEMEATNKERNESGRKLRQLIAEADAAFTRGDENADELMESVVQQVEESGLPPQTFADDKSTQFEFKLQRAKAFQVLKDWDAAKDVYFGILQSMSGPDDGSAPQQRQVFMGLARCTFELGVYEKCLASSEAALDFNRHFPGVHKYKALSEKALGDIDAAIQTMNRAVLYEAPWDEDNKAENLKLYKELLEDKAE